MASLSQSVDICPTCGNPLASDDVFCMKCGKRAPRPQTPNSTRTASSSRPYPSPKARPISPRAQPISPKTQGSEAKAKVVATSKPATTAKPHVAVDPIAKVKVSRSQSSILPSPEISRWERLLLRLDFEDRLMRALLSFLVCLLLLGSIMWGVLDLVAPSELYRVEQNLRDLLVAEAAEATSSLDQVYTFMSAFASSTFNLWAASGRYWCDKPSTYIGWNVTMQAPTKLCYSKWQHAVGVPGRSSWAPHFVSLQNGGISSNCSDSEVGLRLFTANRVTSCAADPGVCSHRLTAQYCRVTCGYCPPAAGGMQYERLEEFKQGPATFMPAVAFQRRRGEGDCDGFASSLSLKVLLRPVMSVARLAFGRPAEPLLTCPRRGGGATLTTSPYAKSVNCSWGLPCAPLGNPGVQNNKLDISFGIEHRGELAFAEVLEAPVEAVARLRQVDWLDSLTDSITVGALVYTRAAETYTYFGVEFEVDPAGGLKPRVYVASLKEHSNWQFLMGRFLFAIILSAICLIFLCSEAILCPQRGSLTGVHSTELLFRTSSGFVEMLMFMAVAVFCAVLLLTWREFPSVSKEYTSLFETFMSVADSSASSSVKIEKAFLGVVEDLRAFQDWLVGIRIAGYLVLMLIIVQWAKCLEVHPRLRVCGQILVRSVYEIFGFLVIATILYVFCAICAHFAFGGFVEGFSTVGWALAAEVRTLAGERLFDSDAEQRLFGARFVCYRFFIVILYGILGFMLFAAMAAIACDSILPGNAVEPPVSSGPVGHPLMDLALALEGAFRLKPGFARSRVRTALSAGCSPAVRRSAPRTTEEMGAKLGADAIALENYVARRRRLVEPERAAKTGASAAELPKLPKLEEIQLDETPSFAVIPCLNEQAQEKLQQSTVALTTKWVDWARKHSKDWEETATTMSCSLVQQAFSLLQANGVSVSRACPVAPPNLQAFALNVPVGEPRLVPSITLSSGNARWSSLGTTVPLLPGFVRDEEPLMAGPKESTTTTVGWLPDNISSVSSESV